MGKFAGRIWKLALTSNIGTVTNIPIFLGMIFLFGSLKVAPLLFSKYPLDFHLAIANFGLLSIVGFSGFFQIIRKEGPGVLGGAVKGIWPVIMGWLWVLLTWGGALYMLTYIVSTLLE